MFNAQLNRWRKKTPRKEIDRLARNLLRRKHYTPPSDSMKIFLIRESKRVGDTVILLCASYGGYYIIRDLLMPGFQEELLFSAPSGNKALMVYNVLSKEEYWNK